MNFLRGQRGIEGFVANTWPSSTARRERVLGDIVDVAADLRAAAVRQYQDAGYAASRRPAGRDADALCRRQRRHAARVLRRHRTADRRAGKEAWAVIPSAVLPNLYKLADNNYNGHHHSSSTARPSAATCANGTGSWKTILVGGLNDGGKGYYALDVTDPLAPKALWEFK